MAINESKLSLESYECWLTPFQATQRLIAAGLEDREHAVNFLIAHLQSGELRAAGIWFDFDDNFNPLNERICVWRASLWEHAERIGWKHAFWISGNYSNPDDALAGRKVLPELFSLIETRFEPDPIQKFCSLAVTATDAALLNQPVDAKHSGGRPPKAFWDDLWAAIGAQLYNGDLKPKRQADIENAMHDWVVAQGYEAGIETIRRPARKLWQAIGQEDQN